jgi:hypothetical protein
VPRRAPLGCEQLSKTTVSVKHTVKIRPFRTLSFFIALEKVQKKGEQWGGVALHYTFHTSSRVKKIN